MRNCFAQLQGVSKKQDAGEACIQRESADSIAQGLRTHPEDHSSRSERRNPDHYGEDRRDSGGPGHGCQVQTPGAARHGMPRGEEQQQAQRIARIQTGRYRGCDKECCRERLSSQLRPLARKAGRLTPQDHYLTIQMSNFHVIRCEQAAGGMIDGCAGDLVIDLRLQAIKLGLREPASRARRSWSPRPTRICAGRRRAISERVHTRFGRRRA